MITSIQVNSTLTVDRTIKVGLVDPKYYNSLGEIEIHLGPARVYMSAKELNTLMYECDTALRHLEERQKEQEVPDPEEETDNG